MPNAQLDATASLHVAGLRATPQRLLILELLAEQGGHLTADDLWKLAAQRYTSFNRSTAFRVLQQLTALGLVKQTRFGQSAHYELARTHGEHHHLLCNNCGAIEDLSVDLIQQLGQGLAARHDFEISEVQLSITGRCRRCRKT